MTLDQSEQEIFNAELTRSELEYLRWQVKLLEQIAIEQAQQLRDAEQELSAANRDLELMNRELQEMLVEKQLTSKAAIEFAANSVAEAESIREVCTQLPGIMWDETVILGELVETPKPVAQASSPAHFIPLASTGLTKLQISASSKTHRPRSLKHRETGVQFTNLTEQELVVKEVLATSRQLSASLLKNLSEQARVIREVSTARRQLLASMQALE